MSDGFVAGSGVQQRKMYRSMIVHRTSCGVSSSANAFLQAQLELSLREFG